MPGRTQSKCASGCHRVAAELDNERRHSSPSAACSIRTHAGGSGCGCSAVVLASYILPKIVSGEWKRILFVPTGALLSKVSFNEGDSIPGIAHGVVIEHMEV